MTTAAATPTPASTRRRPAVDPGVLAALRTRRPSRWLLACAVDWAVIASTFAIVAAVDHPFAYALAIFPLGSRQQGLGALFHDAAHGLVARSRRLNDLLGAPLAAWPLGLTLAGYRRYHLVHHRALGTDRDPEVGHRLLLPHWRLPVRRRQLLHFASDLIGGGLPHLLAAGRMTRPVRAREAVLFVLAWAAALGLAWQLGVLWVPALWVASIATTFWSGVRLRIFTEHLGTRGTHRIRMHRVFEAIVMPHSIGLHWEHHHFPEVPFHNLPLLRERLPTPEIVDLSELLRRFRRSPPLASGRLPADVAADGSPP